MKMKSYYRFFVSCLYGLAIVTLVGCGNKQIKLQGVFKNDDMSYEFKGDKCYGYIEGKLKSESHFKVKGDLIYISPNIPDMKKMIRDVWVVWELKGKKLISRYLIDMNDGTKFYEERSGEIVLDKVQ